MQLGQTICKIWNTLSNYVFKLIVTFFSNDIHCPIVYIYIYIYTLTRNVQDITRSFAIDIESLQCI